MKRILLLVVSGIMLFMMSCGSTGTGSEYMVVGYVAGFRNYDFSEIDATKLTHINYAFANIIDGRVAFGSDMIDNTDRDIEDIKTLLSLKEVNPDLKILVSVGGWGWSGNFSDAALSDSSRNLFAASAAQFILDHGLDGIDLDWEYPNQVGAGNTYRPEDVHNFTLLLASVRRQIDSLAVKLDRAEPFLLTIATGGDSVYVSNTELGELEKYLDFINIMTYDYHNGLTSQAGHHSNLHLSASDYPHGDATDRSVRMHLDAGVSPAKLNIGVPFYGRRWKGVEPVNNGLYREAATTGESISYADVLVALADTAFVRLWDTAALAPWLWNEQDSLFISYDDKESLKAKMEYVLSQGLGGVMFWEYTEDIDGMLLDALVEGLKGK
ncbi:MAG: glycoside hydrolase family 18 protein [Bacteroidales bacterium]|jgi:chitinase|nr:glycoside hydrolase family 18 protein [Bacteroidales bacterium]